MIYNLKALQEAWQNGYRPELLHFWGHQARKDGQLSTSCFSQWWVAPFCFEELTYPTAEHWMMACKARLFDDQDALARILATDTPAKAKKIGREVRNFDGAAWDIHKFEFVVQGNALKFGQHPDLMAFLSSTGQSVIVEASPFDKVWGIGMKAMNPKANDPALWNGSNLLGFALMKVRDTARD